MEIFLSFYLKQDALTRIGPEVKKVNSSYSFEIIKVVMFRFVRLPFLEILKKFRQLVWIEKIYLKSTLKVTLKCETRTYVWS